MFFLEHCSFLKCVKPWDKLNTNVQQDRHEGTFLHVKIREMGVVTRQMAKRPPSLPTEILEKVIGVWLCITMKHALT